MNKLQSAWPVLDTQRSEAVRPCSRCRQRFRFCSHDPGKDFCEAVGVLCRGWWRTAVPGTKQSDALSVLGSARAKRYGRTDIRLRG